jgi:hypothetical protein
MVVSVVSLAVSAGSAEDPVGTVPGSCEGIKLHEQNKAVIIEAASIAETALFFEYDMIISNVS